MAGVTKAVFIRSTNELPGTDRNSQMSKALS